MVNLLTPLNETAVAAAEEEEEAPQVAQDNIGLQILIYDPDTGGITDLTGDTGRGFGNTSLRYAWSMEQVDGDIFVGTLQVNLNALTALRLSLRSEAGMNVESAYLDIPDALGDIPGPLGSDIPTTDNGVWRYSDGTWEQVLGNGSNPAFDAAGVREILAVTVDDDGPKTLIFAGTAADAAAGLAVPDPDYVAQLWVSEDNGDTWTQITTGPSAPGSDNHTYRSFVQMDNQLIVTTAHDSGTAVWAYDVIAETWEQVADFPDSVMVSELEIVTEPSGTQALYMGVSNGFESGDPLQLFRYVRAEEAVAELTDSSALESVASWVGAEITPDTMVIPGGDPDTPADLINRGDDLPLLEDPFNDTAVTEIFYFNGKLFVGTVDFDGATALFYVELQDAADPIGSNKWQLVSADGFGNEDNTYTWAEAIDEENGIAYIGTFDQNGEFDMFSSTDGDTWTAITQDGFGGENNWGIRQMQMLDDGSGDVLIGTASNFLMPGMLEAPNDDLEDRTTVVLIPGIPLKGDGRDNLMLGSEFADSFKGRAGDDVLLGDLGNDTLLGNAGKDDLSGDDGNDLLAGGKNGDYLIGGLGDDTLRGGKGKDFHVGGEGADTFVFKADNKKDFVFDFSLTDGDLLQFKGFDDDLLLGLATVEDVEGVGVYAQTDGGLKMEAFVVGATLEDVQSGIIGADALILV